jgi:hypothetical protein
VLPPPNQKTLVVLPAAKLPDVVKVNPPAPAVLVVDVSGPIKMPEPKVLDIVLPNILIVGAVPTARLVAPEIAPFEKFTTPRL